MEPKCANGVKSLDAARKALTALHTRDKHEGVWCMTGGVFEEAIAIANLMLEGGQEIAQTVRTATFVDNTWKVNWSPVCLSSSVYRCMCHGRCQPLCPCLHHWLCHWVLLGCVIGYVIILCHSPGSVWLSLGTRHLWERYPCGAAFFGCHKRLHSSTHAAVLSASDLAPIEKLDRRALADCLVAINLTDLQCQLLG